MLDLGAGTGLLSAASPTAFSEAEIELLDAPSRCWRRRSERWAMPASAVHVADMAAALPAGPFDAVVSALAIHHLEHADKRALMDRIHAALRPGGVFVNAEQVDAPTPGLTAVYEQRWAEDCRALGATEREIDGARERMRHDRCTDVETQLAGCATPASPPQTAPTSPGGSPSDRPEGGLSAHGQHQRLGRHHL